MAVVEPHLEAITLKDLGTGRQEEVPAAAVFVPIGAKPHTDWLRDMVALDEGGFVLTGRDIPQPAWPASRPPLPFETSVPGVFAAVMSGTDRSSVSLVRLVKGPSPSARSTATSHVGSW
jgi:thioredoxin reductase